MIYTWPAVCISAVASDRCICGRLTEVLILDVLRHLFSLNKWQYRDEYIIVIVVLREKLKKVTIKKLQKSGMVVFQPGIASYNGGHAHH